MDSTRPAEMIFEQDVSEFTSVHIPRSLLLADHPDPPATGVKVTARHPLHESLRNLIAEDAADIAADIDVDRFRSDVFFDFVAMVFGPDPDKITMGQFRNKGGRMHFVSQVIDQNLRDEDFSIDHLACSNTPRPMRQGQLWIQQGGYSSKS